VQFFFEQYYLFSNNFTRYVAGVMYRCEDDKLRSKLTKNLWDEGQPHPPSLHLPPALHCLPHPSAARLSHTGGGAEVDKRHSELFRKFLNNTVRGAACPLPRLPFACRHSTAQRR
jgi:hypothetical protein